MLQYLNHPVVILCGYVIGIIGIMATIYGIFKSRKNKQCTSVSRNYVAIKNYKSVIPDLEIRYAGQQIKDLIITKLGIWNCGKEVRVR
jgi:hypothetical protein